jgi:DNA-binding CsgD family transcriptional regulator
MFVSPRREVHVRHASDREADPPLLADKPPTGGQAPPPDSAHLTVPAGPPTTVRATATVPARAVAQTPTTVPDVLVTATRHLVEPGLVVLVGAPGTGRSSTLRQLGAAFHGTVFNGGALAMLQTVPALALSRALRVRLPIHDCALLAEAVRSRVRQGLLLLDDLQWADPATLAALPLLAEHCRIAVTLRTPHRLPADVEAALRTAAVGWLPVPPLDPAAAEAVVRQVAPGAPAATVADVVRRAGGVPLALIALGRHSTRRDTPERPSTDDRENLTYAIAAALADLGRPARTAVAALGLLGRPAPATLLGSGTPELLDSGLAESVDGLVAPVSPHLAEVAAGLLAPAERLALHRRLAELVPAAEAARHLAAAGDDQAAYAAAVSAAAEAGSDGERAELLIFACQLPGATPDAGTRLTAGRAALTAGRARSCLRIVTDLDAGDPAAAVLRAEAQLQLGAAADAVDAVSRVPDSAPPDILGARDRIRLLAALAADPTQAGRHLDRVLAAHGDPPRHPGLRGAVAAVHAARRSPRWEYALASAAAEAGAAGDALAARWSAWLLVETLAADGRLTDAALAAGNAARACAADLAYSWQTRFLAAELWCVALRGSNLDEVLRRAGDLTDHTLPTVARGYATAAASLTEADGGLLAPARARLRQAGVQPPSTAALLDWVSREAAWLDGQPGLAGQQRAAGGPPLVAGLRLITAYWAAHDAGATADPPVKGDADTVPPVRHTLHAWASPDQPRHFTDAAAAWHDLVTREEVRCLLARGVLETDAEQAVPALLRAEQLAEQAGLVMLRGRAQRALRRHSVRRDNRGRRSGDELTDRERAVLRLVAQGEPTRRIAGQLGISRETVETHIRAGMRKLGARTRTEAAALALEALA